MDLATPFVATASLSEARLAGQGLEFAVFKATSPTHGPVALRVPKKKVYHNVNDPSTDARDLIRQELRIYELLRDSPVPVPRPFGYLEVDGYPAMLCEFVGDDGTEASPAELGGVAALIHSIPLPPGWDTGLVAHEREADALTALVERMERRFRELAREEPSADSWIPGRDGLAPIADGLRRLPSVLCHMDLRNVNLRHGGGCIAAVIDWSNAMVGPSVIDIFRILEYGEHGDVFLQAYTQILRLPPVSRREETFLRLDAALMLALVFISEAPDPERRVATVKRVEELSRALRGSS